MKNICGRALENEFESSLNTNHILTVQETEHLSYLDKKVCCTQLFSFFYFPAPM